MTIATNKKQGILFADIFVNNKELFVKMFAEYYKSNYQVITSTINKLREVLKQYQYKQVTKKMATDFSTCWSEFEKWVLLNTKDLQLIVAYRGQSGRDGRFSQIINQEQVMGVRDGKYGIDSGNQLITDSMKALRATEIESFLQLHLNGFLFQLEQPIDEIEAEQLKRYHNHLLSKTYQHLPKEDIENRRWREPFYNSNIYFSGQGLGKAYDAFMNHLANHNRAVYNYLASGGMRDNVNSSDIIMKEEPSVFTEEGGASEHGKFPQLLNDSLNNTGWYTGGDIIIVNPDNLSIVYNIQLKTTTEKTLSVFAEKIATITNFVNDIESAMTADGGQKLGEKLFDFMLTSVSNADEFNAIPQETINDIIQSTIGKAIKQPNKI